VDAETPVVNIMPGRRRKGAAIAGGVTRLAGTSNYPIFDLTSL
jgi:hypothetical protein